MLRTLLLVAFMAVAGGAQAQIKCWNEGGKRVCGDTPPTGAKVTTLKTPAAPPPAAPAAASKDGKAESKGPLTPAEQEAAFRKRQSEANKAAEKNAAADKEAAAKADNCARARESLRQMEGGQRVARTDAKGERYFLNEAQMAQEMERARQVAQQTCG
jgi:hypothetical protein